MSAMRLTAEQRGYIIVGHCLLAIAINVGINGLIGWLTFRGVDPVPIWGVESSGGPDLIGTSLFLPAITCLIVTPIVRRHVRAGKVAPITAALPGWLRPFRRRLPARAAFFGLAGLAGVGGAVAAALLTLGPDAMPLATFLGIKVAYSGALGGLVQPMIGVVALSDLVDA
jgi:hypothetical protein